MDFNVPAKLSGTIAEAYSEAKCIIPNSKVELVFAKRAKAGDIFARDTLFNLTLPLLYRMACNHKCYTGSPMELISSAFLSLDRALENYDVNSGVRFATFFNYSAMNAMNKETYADRLIRVPEPYIKKNNIPVHAIMLSGMNDADVTYIEECVPDFNQDVIEHASDDDDIKYVNGLIASLSATEEHIITESYGLGGNTEMPDSVLAERYRVSKSRISKIRAAAINKLKDVATTRR